MQYTVYRIIMEKRKKYGQMYTHEGRKEKVLKNKSERIGNEV